MGDRPTGCLTGVARAVALVVVVPLRFLWEILAAVGRAVGMVLYAVFVWPLEMVWRYVLAPVGRVLIVAPVVWLWRNVLAPVGRWLGEWVLVPLLRGFVWVVQYLVVVPLQGLWRYLVVVPLRALWRYVLTPAGLAVLWLFRYLVAIPAVWLWRVLLCPVLRELGRAVVWAWRVAGRVWGFLVVRPCRWVRREVWWPVKAEVRRVLWEVRQALLG
ncbi:hypothetical protein [Kitasatospora sp. GP82]|uniref:hypothetical protein n=1 Tax=Kitasatospora sp. GP82 TaxID=3035089 RepID=UPI00247402FE|nr:hypothetical protein [Kitasatospora sp. GP82]MDH6125167.1 hypothetical protein [Kitasatospora sp. GP82]